MQIKFNFDLFRVTPSGSAVGHGHKYEIILTCGLVFIILVKSTSVTWYKQVFAKFNHKSNLILDRIDAHWKSFANFSRYFFLNTKNARTCDCEIYLFCASPTLVRTAASQDETVRNEMSVTEAWRAHEIPPNHPSTLIFYWLEIRMGTWWVVVDSIWRRFTINRKATKKEISLARRDLSTAKWVCGLH